MITNVVTNNDTLSFESGECALGVEWGEIDGGEGRGCERSFDRWQKSYVS